VATMYFIRVFIIGEILGNNELALQMSELNFFLLVLSFVLIAAGGNIINDYFDVRADRINKPHRVIIGKHVKRRVAMISHIIFNVVGIGLGGYLAWEVGMWKLVILHLFASGSLWFYSVIFKREFLIGNIIVAILAALVPLSVGLFEIPLDIAAYGQEVQAYFLQLDPESDPMIFFKILYYFVLGFAGYAFFLTLVREIQKDMADIEGDRVVGCNTIPIVLGMKKAKLITLILLGVIQVTIIMSWYYFFGDYFTLGYAVVLIIVPLMLSSWKTMVASSRKGFVHAFTFTKIAMGTGLCFAIFFRWLS
jgi:4-hydroxybenzoate polyprenyltransferase